MHVQIPHNKTFPLALRLVKAPGCVYDDLTSTCQTLDGIQTGLRPQASCKHTTTVLLSLSPGPRNKPPTRVWTMVMLMAHRFSFSSHNTIMCCGNGCASGPDNNKPPPQTTLSNPHPVISVPYSRLDFIMRCNGNHHGQSGRIYRTEMRTVSFLSRTKRI